MPVNLFLGILKHNVQRAYFTGNSNFNVADTSAIKSQDDSSIRAPRSNFMNPRLFKKFYKFEAHPFTKLSCTLDSYVLPL